MYELGAEIRHKHMQDANLLHKESPYGNYYTPVIKAKIVGGRLMHVREDNPQFSSSPRDFDGRHPLSPHSSRLQAQDAEIRWREKLRLNEDIPPPDLKIGATVRQSPAEAADRSSRNSSRLLNPYQPLPPIGSESPLLAELRMRIPTVGVTDRPLLLTRDEEAATMQELQQQLRGVDAGQLRHLYMRLSDVDLLLSGTCHLRDVSRAFAEVEMPIADWLLRLAGSMFACGRQQVNYEKMLSLIGASMRSAAAKEQQTAAERPAQSPYYQQRQEQQQQSADSTPRGSPRREGRTPPEVLQQDRTLPEVLRQDRTLPEVLRQLEADLRSAPVPLEALRQSLQRADRQLRGALSGEQLKQIVRQLGIPLREQVMDSVISLCRHRGGGQYDWQQFLQFVERMAPQSTGLRIPSSRKPSEYAKHFPLPAASWPHADGQQPGSRLSPTPPPAPPPPQQQQQRQQQPPPPPPPPPPAPLLEPWFNRFMKLADAMYRHDKNSRGQLPEQEAARIVAAYNAECQLGLPPQAVSSAIASNSRTGAVDINGLLRVLAARQR